MRFFDSSVSDSFLRLTPSLAGLAGAGKLNSSSGGAAELPALLLPLPPLPLPFWLRRFFLGSGSRGVLVVRPLLPLPPLPPGSGESVNLKQKNLSEF